MTVLDKGAIFGATLKTETIHVPQWDGDVVIHEMPVGKREELLGQMIDEDGNVTAVTADLELRLFIAGMHEPEFTADDVAELQQVSGAAVSAVAQAIMKLNGFGDDAVDEARGES